MGRTIKRVAIAMAVVAAAAVLGFSLWVATPLGPDARALADLESSDGIVVTRTHQGWEFTAPSAEPTAGVVIYPGGRVDPRSYAPLARALAKAGYLTIIVRMPLGLAVTRPDAADAVVAAHPDIDEWAIVGHSLGGVMAASHVAGSPGDYDALVLLAAYPPSGVDLRDARVTVGSYVGTRDTVIDMAAWEASAGRLPAQAVIARVEGANHSQWGSYGTQHGDSSARITADVQTAIAVDAVSRALGDLP